MGEKYVQEEFLGEESLSEKYMGEKYVQEEFLGEESLGEKYMVEKYVQEESRGEKYMGEMSVQEKFLCCQCALSGARNSRSRARVRQEKRTPA